MRCCTAVSRPCASVSVPLRRRNTMCIYIGSVFLNDLHTNGAKRVYVNFGLRSNVFPFFPLSLSVFLFPARSIKTIKKKKKNPVLRANPPPSPGKKGFLYTRVCVTDVCVGRRVFEPNKKSVRTDSFERNMKKKNVNSYRRRIRAKTGCCCHTQTDRKNAARRHVETCLTRRRAAKHFGMTTTTTTDDCGPYIDSPPAMLCAV